MGEGRAAGPRGRAQAPRGPGPEGGPPPYAGPSVTLAQLAPCSCSGGRGGEKTLSPATGRGGRRGRHRLRSNEGRGGGGAGAEEARPPRRAGTPVRTRNRFQILTRHRRLGYRACALGFPSVRGGEGTASEGSATGRGCRGGGDVGPSRLDLAAVSEGEAGSSVCGARPGCVLQYHLPSSRAGRVVETWALSQGPCQPPGFAARAQGPEPVAAGWKFPRRRAGASDAAPAVSSGRLPYVRARTALRPLLRGKDKTAPSPLLTILRAPRAAATPQSLVLAGVFMEERVSHPAARAARPGDGLQNPAARVSFLNCSVSRKGSSHFRGCSPGRFPRGADGAVLPVGSGPWPCGSGRRAWLAPAGAVWAGLIRELPAVCSLRGRCPEGAEPRLATVLFGLQG